MDLIPFEGGCVLIAGAFVPFLLARWPISRSGRKISVLCYLPPTIIGFGKGIMTAQLRNWLTVHSEVGCASRTAERADRAAAAKANSRKRRLRKVKGRQQACIGWGNLVTLGMFFRLPL